jgi:hypothetical protein
VPNTERRESVLTVVIALFRRKARYPTVFSACQALRQNETVRHEIRPCCVERGRDESRGLSTLLPPLSPDKLAFGNRGL